MEAGVAGGGLGAQAVGKSLAVQVDQMDGAEVVSQAGEVQIVAVAGAENGDGGVAIPAEPLDECHDDGTV